VYFFATFNNGTIAILKKYTEDDVMIGTMTELIAAAEYNDYILNFILDIVNELI
jgi:hypothetical protein